MVDTSKRPAFFLLHQILQLKCSFRASRIPKEAGNSTKCYLQLLKLQLKSLIGVAEPDCLPDGNFAARQ